MSMTILTPPPDSTCPFCGELGIEGGEVTFERSNGWPTVTQECSCPSCGKGWVDVYEWRRAVSLCG